MPNAASTGSARGAFVHTEVGAVQGQVLEGHVGEVPGLPAVDLVLDRLARPADGRLRQGGLGAERVGQSGLDIADRRASAQPGDQQRLQRVGAAYPDAEQPGRDGLVGAPQLRPSIVTGPAVVMIVVGQRPLRLPGRGAFAVAVILVWTRA